jgi:hypothetical protein
VEGANFYRLLQQDNDGKTTHSRVVAVQYSRGLKATWYPNPVTDRLTIRTGNAQPGVITLFTAGGQPVKQARISDYETTVNLSGLAAGVYIAEIWQGHQKQQLTIVKN